MKTCQSYGHHDKTARAKTNTVAKNTCNVLNYKSIDDDFETKLNQVCVKKLTDYTTKFETQSETLCSALGDVEGDVIERIVQEDCDLNEAAFEMCVLVQRHVDNLALQNKEKNSIVEEEIQENVSLSSKYAGINGTTTTRLKLEFRKQNKK